VNWLLSDRADRLALPIANRHYNRQKPGTPQFVPPGRCLVLRTDGALWVSSWPFAEYVRHEWPGAWINSCFRRESGPLASEMITAAVAATLWHWGAPPRIASIVGPVGMVTFINRDKVRHKRDFGRCYRRAGFEVIGETKGGLLALGLRPEQMPEPMAPCGGQWTLLDPTLRTAQPPAGGCASESKEPRGGVR
jgi:hypothetical protein